MKAFPVRIAMLSRFVEPAEQKKVLEGLRDGTVDLVVGTHRLLSRDVVFNNLGLLVVDEEHRFGVKHKERLKQIAQSVHVLTLTATPIPRTLYMSLSGLRKISLIETPPRNRHPVKTEVTAFDEDTIHDAISEEISRDGQVFFVHNRVQSIYSMKAFLERLVPGVRFGVAHGQMAESELEDAVLDFIDRKYDVLISTMIIESGLDISNVNTLIVNRADRLGLAQLYQLRGRVGRRERQAYAYFMVPRQISLTPAALKRLQAMEEFEELGSGYRLAMRDLEIRGAGNVLGVEQHGHVAAVGFELYTRMLKETVEQLRGDARREAPPCRVESPYSCFIPDRYVPDADERMMLYKRIAHMTEAQEAAALEEELKDRFGELPRSAKDLVDLARAKLEAQALGILLVQMRDPAGASGRPGVRGEAHLEFAPGRSLEPLACARLSETFGRRLLFKAGKSFGVSLIGQPPARVLDEVNNLLQTARLASKLDSLPKR
jgi:transcription-repair coupling factor (superfamily II helicase)